MIRLKTILLVTSSSLLLTCPSNVRPSSNTTHSSEDDDPNVVKLAIKGVRATETTITFNASVVGNYTGLHWYQSNTSLELPAGHSYELRYNNQSLTSHTSEITLTGLRCCGTYTVDALVCSFDDCLTAAPFSLNTGSCVWDTSLPMRFVEVNVQRTTMSLRWSILWPRSAFAFYKVLYNGNTTATAEPYVWLAGLNCYATYRVQIWACASTMSGCCVPGPPIQLHTKVCAPGPVRNVRPKRANVMQTLVTWDPPADTAGWNLFYVVRIRFDHYVATLRTIRPQVDVTVHSCKNDQAQLNYSVTVTSVAVEWANPIRSRNISGKVSPPLRLHNKCHRTYLARASEEIMSIFAFLITLVTVLFVCNLVLMVFQHHMGSRKRRAADKPPEAPAGVPSPPDHHEMVEGIKEALI